MVAQIPSEPLFFYNGEKKEKLAASKEEMLIKFSYKKEEGELNKLAEKLLNEFVQLQSLIDLVSSEDAARFSINETYSTGQDVEDLIKELLGKEEIISAYPILRWKGEDIMITNTIIMAFNPNKVDLDKSRKFIKAHNIKILEEYVFPDNTVQLLTLEKGKHTLEFANQLYELGESLYTQPNIISYAENHYTPNDDSLSTQWYLSNDGSNWNGTVDADADLLEAWDITTGSAKVKVAVLEGGGFDYNHPDARVSQPFDAANNDFDPAPQNANDNHGTAVMGCVAANSDNTIGIAGTGYNSITIPITIGIVNSNGSNFTLSDISITRTANHVINVVSGEGVFVVTNSWGGGVVTAAQRAAYDNMIINSRNGLGAVVMASSGNSDLNNNIQFPALHPGVMAVGSSSPCDTRKSSNSCDGENWWGSDWGDSLNIMAPGVKIQTLDRSGAAGYSTTNYVPDFNGTSSACPIAAGITALVFSMDRCMTRQEVEGIICSTTDKIDTTTYNNVANRPYGTWSRFTGYGRINAFKAVSAVNTPNTTSTVANRTDNTSIIYQNTNEINVGPNYFITGNPYIQFRSSNRIIFQPKVQSIIGSAGLITAKISPSCINP